MKDRKTLAICVLRLVLGIVVLVQSLVFLYGRDSARFFAGHGLPEAVRLLLGWSDVLAALLFMLPPTVFFGGCLLLAVFCGAILIHLLHGQFEIGGLLVYLAAVLVVITNRDRPGLKTDASAS